MRLLRRAISMEEENGDGVARHEIELTYYAKLIDFTELLSAVSKEHQEQWEIKVPKTDGNAGDGRIRIRKTMTDFADVNSIKYVLTSKLNTKEVGKCVETSTDSTIDQFNVFKVLSDTGMIKDRFTFKIPDSDLVWEFDLFYKDHSAIGSGHYHEWVKIDIEVPSMDIEIPPLPIKVTDLITAQKDAQSPEVMRMIASMYEQCFITKNMILQSGT